MPVSAARLRRWFVIALVLVCVVVGGTYLYLRHRVRNALKEIPSKIGIEVQQSAEQFTISKSEQGRTLFKLQASKAVQFKHGGRAELHNVTITLYGRDSSRFDQVYGEAFDYDPQSGDVSSQGEISIDLQANPEGALHPDQATPKALKNPIHLKTRGVVFNKNTGNAWTDSKIEFRVPQASGSAVGARYVAKEAALTLESQIRIVMTGATPGTILADRALLQKAPREIVLTHPHAETPQQQAQADELTLFLNDDNMLDHAVATGGVGMESRDDLAGSGVHVRAGGKSAKTVVRQSRAAGATWSELTAQRLDVSMKPNNEVRNAALSGDVRFESKGSEALEGSATRAMLDFGAGNSLRKVHAEGGVKLVQTGQESPHPNGAKNAPLELGTRSGTAQDFEISSPAMDFLVTDEKLTRAETVGAPEILLSQAGANSPAAATRITASKFSARFDALGNLSQVRGAPNVRVVSPAPAQNGNPQPDRVSTSDRIVANFGPKGGMSGVVQEGNFTFTSGTLRAFAQSARYQPEREHVVIEGSPRMEDVGTLTTADTFILNRSSGQLLAQGHVKTSYSDVKAQPAGALLAASDPIHVTANQMTASNDPGIATYTGNARLWQNANVIEAPSIQFQKEQRTVVANSKGDQKVSTILVGTDQKGKATLVTILSGHLVYRDSERKAHFDGGVTVHGSDLTITAKQMDVFLAQAPAGTAKTAGEAPAPHEQSQPPGPAHLDKIVASGSIVITEPTRRATGERLVYTAAEDKFVLTGGPPSIFDAEHGKITAVSLTLFRRDGRVVVEGDSKSPAVTETQVVR